MLNGVFAEAVAWVSWDDDRPGYESISSLSKVERAAEREVPSQSLRANLAQTMLRSARTIPDHNGRERRFPWSLDDKNPVRMRSGKRPGLLASVSAGRLPHATSFARGWVANGKVVPPIVALKPNFCSILSCGS